MADKVDVDRRAMAAILRLPATERMLRRMAESVAARAGDGFVADSEIGSSRARAAVFTATFQAMHAEATDHRLLASLDAARR